jgi:hypothetical protein
MPERITQKNLQGKNVNVLLDEQLIAFERVMDAARSGFKDRKKAVIIIRGVRALANPSSLLIFSPLYPARN